MEKLREIEAWLIDEMSYAEDNLDAEGRHDIRQWWYGMIEGYRHALQQVQDALKSQIAKSPKLSTIHPHTASPLPIL